MLGYRFCLQRAGLGSWPLRVESKLGSHRGKEFDGDHRLTQTFPSTYVPRTETPEAIFEHLEFALRYEGVDLAALAAIFAQVDPTHLSEWLVTSRGQHLRRNDDGTDGLAGIGVQVNVYKQWSLGAEFTRYGIDGDHIDFAGVGVSFRW